jgi:GT2 family glycosyltransferase
MAGERPLSREVRSVSIAVLSWNGREHLEHCLEALARQREPGIPWEVAILDNGSTDGSAEWLERTWLGRRLGARGQGRVRLERSDRNLGFCAGNNLLVEGCEMDAVALLNNDTRPRPEWLAELVAALAEAPADVAAVSGLILDWEGERLDFARGILTFDGHAFQLGYRRRLADVVLPPDGEELLFPCGGNVLIRRASFLEAGGFDPTYFAYLEDVDLGWRLWSGGERVQLARHAVVEHRSMASSGNLGLYRRGFLFERNALLTAYKNYDAESWGRLMPVVLLTFLSRVEAMLAENNPAGATVRFDPYSSEASNQTATATVGAAAQPRRLTLAERWRLHGTRQMLRRALHKTRRVAARRVFPDPWPTTAGFEVSDERSLAQLRAGSFVLRHLDAAARDRQRALARRRRSDREIFERFPLYLVPTYPGDAELFSRPGFRSWLPADLPVLERTLDQVMELAP